MTDWLLGMIVLCLIGIVCELQKIKKYLGASSKWRWISKTVDEVRPRTPSRAVGSVPENKMAPVAAGAKYAKHYTAPRGTHGTP
jgi:hypothetical protein